MARAKIYKIFLTDDELAKLKAIIRRKNTSKTIKCRCQILIDLDEAHGDVLTHQQAARSNGVCMSIVTNTIKLYADDGIGSVVSIKRSVNSDNARRKLDGRAEARLIEIAYSPAPEGHSRWTLHLLEEEAKVALDTPVGKNAIGRALKNRLQPHRSEYWCIPKKGDAEFVACMEDVLDVYELPYDPQHPVVCMDEKLNQLLDDARDALPMRPGDIQKVDSEYVRNGTCSIIAFVEPLGSRHYTSVHEHRTALDWAEEIKYLVAVMYPDAERIILAISISPLLGVLYKTANHFRNVNFPLSFSPITATSSFNLYIYSI